MSWKSLEDLLRRERTSQGERISWDCPRVQFGPAARSLQEAGARLLTLSAMRLPTDELNLTYTFEIGASNTVTLRTPTEERAIESLFSSFPAADFLEREVSNLFGVKFLGHPNLPHYRETLE
jgi:NADH:ubiquinone oxidoreductase subunit C